MKIPKRKAWLLIFLSVVIVSGVASSLLGYMRYIQDKRLRDPKFRLVALAQRSADGEWLKTGFLAEQLGISVDRPVSLLGFKMREAEQRLLANPLIKEARLSKIMPGTLSIEYVARKPVAFLGDYSNTALDEEGFLFPFHPFYTPKNLPEFYLGYFSEDSLWGRQLKGPHIELAFNIYGHLMELGIKRIDVSKAFDLSYGQRQIVVILEERWTQSVQTRILRLSTAHWKKELARYLVLRDYLLKKEGTPSLEMVIDLRVPLLGIIKN